MPECKLGHAVGAERPKAMGGSQQWPLNARVSGVVIAITLLAVACGGGSKPKAITTPASTSAAGYSLIQAQSNLPVGTSRFVFGIADPGNNLITGGEPQVFVAKDQHSPTLGPF